MTAQRTHGPRPRPDARVARRNDARHRWPPRNRTQYILYIYNCVLIPKLGKCCNDMFTVRIYLSDHTPQMIGIADQTTISSFRCELRPTRPSMEPRQATVFIYNLALSEHPHLPPVLYRTTHARQQTPHSVCTVRVRECVCFGVCRVCD